MSLMLTAVMWTEMSRFATASLHIMSAQRHSRLAFQTLLLRQEWLASVHLVLRPHNTSLARFRLERLR